MASVTVHTSIINIINTYQVCEMTKAHVRLKVILYDQTILDKTSRAQLCIGRNIPCSVVYWTKHPVLSCVLDETSRAQ